MRSDVCLGILLILRSSVEAFSGGRLRLGSSRPFRPISAAVRPRATMVMEADTGDRSFTMAVLGDLHLDEDDMVVHEAARDEVVSMLEREAFILETQNRYLVSLGDLGDYGGAGTTRCFDHAKEYLDGFDTRYDLVTGNHDLEGMDEFETDEENLLAWQRCFGREMPQFCTQISNRTLAVGLSTVRFRDAPYSSHEVYVDDAQLEWFEDVLARHPEADGWRVLVFTHAPPMGSGLRVVQGVHIRNGCAWLNHSADSDRRRAFVRLCRQHRCIKAWFSGHFHLSHDYEDSISVVDGCAFVQVGVIGEKSTRDGRRQTRLVRGTEEALEIYTVNHHDGGEELRLDLTLRYSDGRPVEAHGHEDYDHADWFSAYTPQPLDGCYMETNGGLVAAGPHSPGVVCWWHMADGRVLGVHDGMVVEYDAELLSPLGVVCDREELHDREVVVVEGGTALLLAPWRIGADEKDVTVVHPNQDGSYWRKYQKNKLMRTREKEREALARDWMKRRALQQQ
ncbi:unnamed protein product [Phaeothamnion confervicola]